MPSKYRPPRRASTHQWVQDRRRVYRLLLIFLLSLFCFLLLIVLLRILPPTAALPGWLGHHVVRISRDIARFLHRVIGRIKRVVWLAPGRARLRILARLEGRSRCKPKYCVDWDWGEGTGGIDVARYRKYLEKGWEEWMSGSSSVSGRDVAGSGSEGNLLGLQDILGYLEGPAGTAEGWNRTIHTFTAQQHGRGAPHDTWQTLNPGWTRRSWEAHEVSEWVEEAVGTDAGLLKMLRDLEELGGETVGEAWKYLVLLFQGGLYTSPYTACVRSIHSWTRDIEPLADWSRTSYSTLDTPSEEPSLIVALTDRCAPLPHSRSHPFPHETSASSAAIERPEVDQLRRRRKSNHHRRHAKLDQDQGHSRKCSTFNQLTFLAKPGHPVFLDVLINGANHWERYHQALLDSHAGAGSPPTGRSKEADGQLKELVQAFGPSALSVCMSFRLGAQLTQDRTNAVFRYLLVRYGITPDQIKRATGPLQVGDVAILPSGSFSARYRYPSHTESRALVWQDPPDR